MPYLRQWMTFVLVNKKTLTHVSNQRNSLHRIFVGVLVSLTEEVGD
jgi:hypothetical protein